MKQRDAVLVTSTLLSHAYASVTICSIWRGHVEKVITEEPIRAPRHHTAYHSYGVLKLPNSLCSHAWFLRFCCRGSLFHCGGFTRFCDLLLFRSCNLITEAAICMLDHEWLGQARLLNGALLDSIF